MDTTATFTVTAAGNALPIASGRDTFPIARNALPIAIANALPI
jgi:hypothetical protein